MKRIITLLLLGLCFAMSPPAEAQFLNKLSKGLKQVNNALEQVDKLKKDKDKKSKKQKDKARGESSVQSAADAGFDDSDWKSVDNVATTPFITPQTKFLAVGNVYREFLSDVHEDIFWIARDGKYEFWTIDGRKLFGNDWENISYGGATPRFNGGVAVAKRAKANAAGKKIICLLYRDGAVRELDASYSDVSQFCDGLAMVKKKVNSKDTYFFINARGEKVFPTLTVYDDSGYGENPVRPLRDGLRAYAAAYRKWGYIDASGKVVIPAKYLKARDFHDGYAWVTVGDKTMGGAEKCQLIDTRGNVVYTTDAPSSDKELSDVSDGIFFREKDNETFYYNVRGEELGHFEGGNRFYDGYAFVVPMETREFTDISTALIDTECRIVKRISDHVVASYIPEDNGPVFEPYGLATVLVDATSLIIDPRGNVVVRSFDNYDTDTKVAGFKQLTACGYARVTDMKIRQKAYRAIMRADGMIEWIFGEAAPEDAEQYLQVKASSDAGTENGGLTESGPGPGHKPGPGSDSGSGTELPQPTPPVIKTINVHEPPIGPTKVIEKTYKVNLTTKGNGTATLSPAGPFRYGDMVTINAVPAENWAVGHIDIQGDGAEYLDGKKPMAVTADLDITVIFVERPDVDNPDMSGCFQGVQEIKFDLVNPTPIDVYAEISENPDIESPYGKNTYGFLVMMIDPTVRRMGKGMSAYTFGMPLKISGYEHDASGDEWLICDGGTLAAHDIRMETGSGLAGLFYKMMMSFDGTDNIQGVPRRYRIHIDKRDKETGEITLGRLEVFSLKAGGWVPGGHKSVHNTKKGLFMNVTEKGWPADTYQGVVLKPAEKRNDVYWYAPAMWYKNKAIYETIVESMRNSYGTFRTDVERLF